MHWSDGDLLGYLKEFRDAYSWVSREFQDGRRASNSEIRRWIVSGAVVLNGRVVRDPCHPMRDEAPIESLVLFPKGRMTTIL